MTDGTNAQPASGHDTLRFEAEVGRLLDLMVHSVYSDKEIFLRELISNAADACDRLRHAAITAPDLLAGDADFRITVTVDKPNRTITIADNGIGMSREELVSNLGTIARSGTAAFVGGLDADAKKAVTQIGQFGVGFYSAFMIAGKVEVFSRRAGEAQGHVWASDGKGTFTVGETAEAPARGTRIVMHARAESDEFLDAGRLSRIVKTYSDHVSVPVSVGEAGKEAAEPVNTAAALWTRAKSDITPEQYANFYRDTAHAFDEPWLTLHWRAEGRIEYTGLLFVPGAKPFDLFHPDRKPGVKLYVKRVFIADDTTDIVPSWLRFLRGVVDSEDLPLNISREMLQQNAVLKGIRAGIVRRVLGDLKAKAEKEPEVYTSFWENFGPVLKEGLYEDDQQRDALFALTRLRSTHGEGWTSLADYVSRMRPGQNAIYYVSGEDIAALRQSPQIEGFRAKGVEVLLLADPIDEFWIGRVGTFDGKPFKSVTRGGADLGSIEAPEDKKDESAEPAADLKGLLALLKLKLGDAVKDVRSSDRLTDSPVCLVADDGDLDLHLERLLKAHGQANKTSRRILELNPRHALVKALANKPGEALDDAAWLLLDQARILEGEPPADPAAFARRLSRVLEIAAA